MECPIKTRAHEHRLAAIEHVIHWQWRQHIAELGSRSTPAHSGAVVRANARSLGKSRLHFGPLFLTIPSACFRGRDRRRAFARAVDMHVVSVNAVDLPRRQIDQRTVIAKGSRIVCVCAQAAAGALQTKRTNESSTRSVMRRPLPCGDRFAGFASTGWRARRPIFAIRSDDNGKSQWIGVQESTPSGHP